MIKYLQQLNAYPAVNGVSYFDGLNSVKGILIFLIIITHCLPNGMALYFMYLFHMPLFLAIGGFLLKESTFQKGFKNFVRSLFNRLVIPWFIAFLVYLPLQLGERLFSQVAITDLLYPFFHLWYIPAYVMGAIICFGIDKWKLPIWPILCISGLITISWYVFFRDVATNNEELPLFWIGDKRIYAYLFFFITGYSLRNQLIHFRPLPLPLIFIMLSSFVILTALVLEHAPNLAVTIPYLFFNFSLAIFVLLIIGPAPFMQHRLWLLFNKQSLGIYLYHPIIIIMIYQLLGDPQKQSISQLGGIGIGLFTMLLVTSLTWLFQKWKFTNQYFLGNIKKK